MVKEVFNRATLYVNAEDVEELKGLTVEDLLKLSMTAGVGAGGPTAESRAEGQPQEGKD